MTGKLSKNLIALSIVIAGLIIAGALIYINQGKIWEKAPKVLTQEEIGEKVVKYINENLLKEGVQATLISITVENELYKLKLKVKEEEFDAYVTKDGRSLFFQSPIDLDKKLTTTQEPEKQEDLTIGDFSISTDEICKESGKPTVYFFGSSTCPHCSWEHPLFENIVSKFKDNLVFHNNMDSEKDSDVFSKYSTGYIPTLVLGCKYYRVGSGETRGEEEEGKILTALICKLTEGKPEDVCTKVQDLINQIGG